MGVDVWESCMHAWEQDGGGVGHMGRWGQSGHRLLRNTAAWRSGGLGAGRRGDVWGSV